MADTTRLQIGIDARGAKEGAAQTNEALKSIQDQATKTSETIEKKFGDGDNTPGKAAEKTASRFDKLKEKIFSVHGALAGLGFGAVIAKIVETNVEFQRLEANLKTVTGSAMGAKAAFAELQKFAASTPFSLRGLTDAFTTLKLAGVDTSTRALTAFGNIASSFGRDITELAVAVKSAMAGEMEALSAFGPKVLVDNDKFIVAFQGKTQKIERSAYALEQYLIKLGETQFAGGMANQMETLAGQWSNFGDNLDRIMSQIGAGGLNDALADLLSWLNELSSSGDDVAKEIGEVLGNAVRFLTEGLKFLAENFDIIIGLFKAWVAAQFVFAMVELAQAVIAAAKAFGILNAVMAVNPFVLLLGILAAVIAYLIDITDLLGLTEDKTKKYNQEADKMIDKFRKADKSSLQNVLSTSTAIADEMERTNDELGQAGVSTEAWVRKMMALKAIQQENLKAAVEFIRDMTETSIVKADDQDTLDKKDELSLRDQLAIAKSERDQARGKLLDANTKARGALSANETGVETTQQMGAVTLHFKEKVEFTNEGVQKLAKDALEANAELDRAMGKVDQIQGKIDADAKKRGEKSEKKEEQERLKALDKLREGLAGLAQDAADAQFELEQAMQFGTDDASIEKQLKFRAEYNKLTKNGTIPITEAETAQLKKSVDTTIDLRREREALVKAQKEQKEIFESVADKQREMNILNDKDIKDKDLAVKLAQYRADLERQGVSNINDLVREKEKELKLEKDLNAQKAFAANVEDLDKRIKDKKEELRLSKLTAEEKAVEAEVTKAIADAEKEGKKLNAEQLDLIRKKATELYTITDELGKQKEEIKEQNKALKDFLEDGSFESTMESLTKLGLDAIEQLSDAFVEFIFTGEKNFAEFFQSLAKDIAKLIVKLLVAQAIAYALNSLVPGAGTAAVQGGGLVAASVKHTGGLSNELTSTRLVHPMTFANAPHYKAGRIPGVSNNEIPAILHDREAVVPLPNGRSIPVDMKGNSGKTENHYHSWNLPNVTKPEEFRKTTRQLENEWNLRTRRSKRR